MSDVIDHAASDRSTRIGPLADALAARLGGSGPRVEIVGAAGGFAGLALAALRRRLDRPLAVVVPDDAAARDLTDGLGFFEATGDGLSRVARLRALDHLPFQGMSPTRTIVMDRVATLFRLSQGLGVDALVIPARCLVDRVMPRAALAASAQLVLAGESLDRDELVRFLASSGYHPAPTVEDPGSFAVRGGLLDVYAPLYDLPLRIDMWGDEVETIRFFDPVTQRSVSEVGEVAIGPAHDVIFTDASIERARRQVLDLADELDVPTSRARAMVDDIERGVLGVGMEDLLPAFHDHLETVFDAVTDSFAWLVIDPEACRTAIEDRWDDVRARSVKARKEAGMLTFKPSALFVSAKKATAMLDRRAAGHLVSFEVTESESGLAALAAAGTTRPKVFRFEAADNSDVRRDIEAAARDPDAEVLAPLVRRVRKWREDSLAVVVCAHTEGGAERLAGLMSHYGLMVEQHEQPFGLDQVTDLRVARSTEVHLFIGEPGQGFRAPELGLVILDEAEILGRRSRHRRRRRDNRAPSGDLMGSWRDLHEGDYVVHLMHGLGRYKGFEKTAVDNVVTDFLVLEYADGNKLFVPVDKLHLVSRYQAGEGEGDNTEQMGDGPRAARGRKGPKQLDKLGGTGWARTTKRVRKAVRNIADKLLVLYAEREMRTGYAFGAPGEYFTRFEAAFPYEETPDQAKTIEEVLDDMQREQPMDRLVCGDVGFGKTEVAMRGAMLAILAGKQVAVLVPTLVLAEQHKLTFERRFAGFPVTVETLHRNRTSRETRELLFKIKGGGVDVVIGTHRLLGKDVEFRDLGLMVVDEEHRFGVAQKERLKRYKASVDILTLTATPIPRTLNMAMAGLRDISLIQTPPLDRLSVRTLVAQPNEDVIREAIEGELARGGQVFYVHNRIDTIGRHADLLRHLVPDARIVVAHGQMERGVLQRVMMRFIRGEANVLVSTTVIESGLDIPAANTMLIDRADRFGLAQLYQLRGRIGRSSVRAFCYLLIPSPRNLVGDAAKRIAAIQRFSELGSGVHVASWDLDIRGAGEILGADQSGHIGSVGYEAYMELLREAIEELRRAEAAGEGGTPAPPVVDPEMTVRIEGRLPESWLGETSLRLRLYRELAGAQTIERCYELLRDAVDRYGRAPEPVHNLVGLMATKIEARALHLVKVSYGKQALALTPSAEGPLSPHVLASFVSRPDCKWRLTPRGVLVRPNHPGDWERGLDTLRDALRELASYSQRFERAEAERFAAEQKARFE